MTILEQRQKEMTAQNEQSKVNKVDVSALKLKLNFSIDNSYTNGNLLELECISTGKLSCDVIIKVPPDLNRQLLF
ncbi:MAG: hypothetical protein K0R18_1991 [Bacillales bacterium]|jgi:hypothetical protein|nr:hypothetical protein [Bacillales bacterium]